MAKPLKKHTIESLLERTEEEGECMLWTGYFGARSCPQVYHEGSMVSVRLLLMQLAGKNCKNVAFVGTTCDNPKCVNPDHRQPRTQKQHMQKMAKLGNEGIAGMLRKANATKARRAREDSTGMEVARLIAVSDESGPILAQRYGVTRSTVNNIKRGRTYSAGVNPFAGLM